jgi:hypothetical protein
MKEKGNRDCPLRESAAFSCWTRIPMLTCIGSRLVTAPLTAFERKGQELRFGCTRMRVLLFLVFQVCLFLLAAALSNPAGAQNAATEEEQVADSITPLHLVRWTGSLPEAAGRTVEMSFGLYASPSGGSALWSETQTVKVGADGRYSVLLGASSAEGLPQKLFEDAESRWIEGRLSEGQLAAASVGDSFGQAVAAPPPARSLLVAVPYAFKSTDAEALGGRAAEDFVTIEDLKSAVADQVQSISLARFPSQVGGALNGPGTAGYLPIWTGSSLLGNSLIFQSGSNVGLGTPAPATLLDVNGASTFRATANLLASAATIVAGMSSPALLLGASTYSSTSNAAVPQNFVWQAVSAGNNTGSPTANLALLFGSGAEEPTATGLSIAPNGQITFAPGQMFPGVATDSGTGGASSSISNVIAGPGLTGGGSSGSVTIALSMPIPPQNGGTGCNNSSVPGCALTNLGAQAAMPGVTSDGANGVKVAASVAAGPTALPAGAPAGTLSGSTIYSPGLIVPVTAFGAKCNWNGSTGTDDTAAFLAAWATVLGPGGIIELPARACYVPNGLNLSTSTVGTSAGTRGFRGQGNASQIVTKNANIGMDLGGVSHVLLEKFFLTDVGTTANVGIARYRVLVAGGYQGGGGHTYRDVQILGAYAISDLYSIASEVNNHFNVSIYQYGKGSGVTINNTNCLNMTGQGQTIYPNSDTVNHFYGGAILADVSGSTGGAVLFCNGSADNVSFDGTYFEGGSTGYDVRFGLTASDNVQGSKVFENVRFEGSADALSMVASEVDNLMVKHGSTFGEISPGIDINYTNTSTGWGLHRAEIDGNTHLGRGLIIPVISSSYIRAITVFGTGGSYPVTTLTVNGGISESEIETNAFSLGSSAYVSGSTLIQSTDYLGIGTRTTLYGPNSPTSRYNSAGSTIAMRPFGAAPANPVVGELAIADGVNWQPDGVASQTLVQWNGTAWVPAVAVSGGTKTYSQSPVSMSTASSGENMNAPAVQSRAGQVPGGMPVTIGNSAAIPVTGFTAEKYLCGLALPAHTLAGTANGALSRVHYHAAVVTSGTGNMQIFTGATTTSGGVPRHIAASQPASAGRTYMVDVWCSTRGSSSEACDAQISSSGSPAVSGFAAVTYPVSSPIYLAISGAQTAGTDTTTCEEQQYTVY